LERLLLTSKSFLSFWEYYVPRMYWAEIFEKILHGFKPCEFGKGMFLTHRFYYSPSFPFLDQKIL